MHRPLDSRPRKYREAKERTGGLPVHLLDEVMRLLGMVEVDRLCPPLVIDEHHCSVQDRAEDFGEPLAGRDERAEFGSSVLDVARREGKVAKLEWYRRVVKTCDGEEELVGELHDPVLSSMVAVGPARSGSGQSGSKTGFEVSRTDGSTPPDLQRRTETKISISRFLRGLREVARRREQPACAILRLQRLETTRKRRLTVLPCLWVLPCCLPSPMTRSRFALSCVKGERRATTGSGHAHASPQTAVAKSDS